MKIANLPNVLVGGELKNLVKVIDFPPQGEQAADDGDKDYVARL